MAFLKLERNQDADVFIILMRCKPVVPALAILDTIQNKK